MAKKKLSLTLTLLTAIALILAACSGGSSGTGSGAGSGTGSGTGTQTETGAQNETGTGTSETAAEELPSVNLIVSHFLPSTHKMNTEVLPALFDEIQEKTDGRITYELYPANLLGEPAAHYDMVVTGEADVGLSVHGYTTGRFPLVSVMEMPFLVESAEAGSMILQTLFEEFPEMADQHKDTHTLFAATFQAAQIVSNKYKIETLNDLKGLRVRTPSEIGSRIIEALGATPVSMPMGEVYESLQRGVIDAAFIPMETLYNYNLHEVTKYITIGNFTASTFFLVMNQDTYNNLPDSDKAIVDAAAGIKAAQLAGSKVDEDAAAGRQVSEEKGIEFVVLEGEAFEPWKAAAEQVTENWIQEMEEKGFPARAIYERAVELKEQF